MNDSRNAAVNRGGGAREGAARKSSAELRARAERQNDAAQGLHQSTLAFGQDGAALRSSATNQTPASSASEAASEANNVALLSGGANGAASREQMSGRGAGGAVSATGAASCAHSLEDAGGRGADDTGAGPLFPSAHADE